MLHGCMAISWISLAWNMLLVCYACSQLQRMNASVGIK